MLNNNTLNGLVDHIQMIEDLLEEYYIETDFLKLLNDEKLIRRIVQI